MNALGVTVGAMMDMGNVPYWILLVAIFAVIAIIAETKS